MVILRKQFSEGPRKSRELRFKDPDVRFRGREPEEGEEDEEMEDPVEEESEDTEPEFDEDMISKDNLKEAENLYSENQFKMIIEDVFNILGKGTAVTGYIESGSISVRDVVKIGKNIGTVSEIIKFRHVLDTADETSGNIGLVIDGINRKDIKRGDIILKL